MLQKDPAKRITAIDSLNHKWFERSHDETLHLDKKIFQRLKNFRAPQRLQVEALTFLVSNLNKDIDFKGLREAFRSLDKTNTGILTLNEIREALKEMAVSQEDIL